jgi:uncharacterized protein
MRIGRVLLIGLAVYAGMSAVLAISQTRLLFPTWLTLGSHGPLPGGAQGLAIDTPDGDRLVGVRLPPPKEARENVPLLLAFGGNAWNAIDLALFLRDVLSETEVVAFHYRGYSPSTGRPSARAILDDSLLLYDHVASTSPSPERIVAVGLSLGAGAAAHLAAHRPVAGVVLVTPFDSLEELAVQHYPWMPVRLLLRHHMPIAELMRTTAVPAAILAAENDTIVFPERTAALRPAVPNLVFDRTIAGADHNDLYGSPEFSVAMNEALARIEEAGGTAAPR